MINEIICVDDKLPLFDSKRLAPLLSQAVIEVYQSFIHSGTKTTEAISAAFAQDDLEQLHFWLHRLKGSAGNVGASRLHHFAGQLEATLKKDRRQFTTGHVVRLVGLTAATSLAIQDYLTTVDDSQYPEIVRAIDSNQIVYIVDDDVTCSSYVKILVQQLGYAGVTNNDARAFWEKFPDQCKLVLLDHMMPGKSGVEILDEIRERYSEQQLPVVMFTSRGEDSDILNALDSGASDYLIKPVDPRIAQNRIRVQMENRLNLERQMQLAELDAIRTMVVTYNHEINNPLAIAFALVERMDTKGGDPEHQEKIRKNLERIRDIVIKIGELSSNSPREKVEYLPGLSIYKVS